jgi:hypothetical protein
MTKDEMISKLHSLQNGKLRVGTKWKHFKGDTYEITGHSFNTVTEKFEILYTAFPSYEYTGIVYSRPIEEWETPLVNANRFEPLRKFDGWLTQKEIRSLSDNG